MSSGSLGDDPCVESNRASERCSFKAVAPVAVAAGLAVLALAAAFWAAKRFWNKDFPFKTVGDGGGGGRGLFPQRDF